MALEQVFKCSLTLNKLRDGPLGELMDGFCDALLKDGFSRSTVRRHLSNVAHLNAYLGARKNINGQVLCAQTVSDFLKDYPVRARNRGPLNKHVAGIKSSVNRLVDYLRLFNRFESRVKPAVYQSLLEAYLDWLEQYQHAAPGTIERRAQSISQFLRWLGPLATSQRVSERSINASMTYSNNAASPKLRARVPACMTCHTTAMHLLRSGNDINMISYWLGHADINTTHIYLEIDMEMKRKMIEKVDAPTLNGQAPWHKPGVLEWLNELGKKLGLCAVNQEQMKKNLRIEGTNFT